MPGKTNRARRRSFPFPVCARRAFNYYVTAKYIKTIRDATITVVTRDYSYDNSVIYNVTIVYLREYINSIMCIITFYDVFRHNNNTKIYFDGPRGLMLFKTRSARPNSSDRQRFTTQTNTHSRTRAKRPSF